VGGQQCATGRGARHAIREIPHELWLSGNRRVTLAMWGEEPVSSGGEEAYPDMEHVHGTAVSIAGL
jgi:hypothetical protein